ncbi:hypothetical protein N657DRAFT_436071 [Parathielavia appendiculata]|uniref:Uncharacterized protein n=1 Tax=Parathielavia appendiculata TaxID=2587402 RepID=A0AAN6U081_9PEZI|nr:hypothetical protein N657DRAFT_436071 [Parathielavia appendiculata]
MLRRGQQRDEHSYQRKPCHIKSEGNNNQPDEQHRLHHANKSRNSPPSAHLTQTRHPKYRTNFALALPISVRRPPWPLRPIPTHPLAALRTARTVADGLDGRGGPFLSRQDPPEGSLAQAELVAKGIHIVAVVNEVVSQLDESLDAGVDVRVEVHVGRFGALRRG